LTILGMMIACDICGAVSGSKEPKAILTDGKTVCQPCGNAYPDRVKMWIEPTFEVMGPPAPDDPLDSLTNIEDIEDLKSVAYPCSKCEGFHYRDSKKGIAHAEFEVERPIEEPEIIEPEAPEEPTT